MAVSKFRIKRIVARETIPQMEALAREIIEAHPRVERIVSLSVETDRHNPYYNDHFPTNQFYKHWFVSLVVNAVLETTAGRTVAPTLHTHVRHTPQGAPNLSQARDTLQELVEEKGRIGFENFDFSLSLHADQIPAEFTVAVAPVTIASEEVEVTIYSNGYEHIKRTYPLGPKVVDNGHIKVYVGRQPLWINTAIAHYVKATIEEAQTGVALVIEDEDDAPFFTPALIQDFESSATIMVKEFGQHAALARAAAF